MGLKKKENSLRKTVVLAYEKCFHPIHLSLGTILSEDLKGLTTVIPKVILHHTRDLLQWEEEPLEELCQTTATARSATETKGISLIDLDMT